MVRVSPFHNILEVKPLDIFLRTQAFRDVSRSDKHRSSSLQLSPQMRKHLSGLNRTDFDGDCFDYDTLIGAQMRQSTLGGVKATHMGPEALAPGGIKQQ